MRNILRKALSFATLIGIFSVCSDNYVSKGTIVPPSRHITFAQSHPDYMIAEGYAAPLSITYLLYKSAAST